MAGPAGPSRADRQVVIDLSSDSDDSDVQPQMLRASVQLPGRIQRPAAPATPLVDNQAFFGAPAPFNFNDFVELENNALANAFRGADGMGTPATVQTPPDQNRRGEIIVIDGEEIFIPDETPEPFQPAPQPDQAQIDADREAAASLEMENCTADTCLQRTLAIFPDISHEHVHALYNGYGATIPGPERLEQIIDKLVSGERYPKQEKGKKRKREKEDDGDERRWAGADREIRPPTARSPISAMLKAEFPEIPLKKIGEELQTHIHLYQTYVALAEAKDSSEGKHPWRGRPSKLLADAETIAVNSGYPTLGEELKAARKKVEGVRLQRATDEAKKQAEHENLQRAMAAGETAECQACFEDLPMNRQVHCDGDAPHFTCFECLETYIKSEVGQSRCGVLCTAGCGAAFAYAQLHRLEDKGLIQKLEQLQQEKAIRDAGIDDLEECPFCDYKAIMPPIEVDFEFRCDNPDCEKVSCRRCKAISHTPVSCEEYAKDNKLNSRHKIEEAMTAALLRTCNKCKKQFIKEYGCNKMACSSCGNLQCYVCSQSLQNYDHFDQGPAGGQARAKKCPLYDNVEERHEREVKEAEAAARRQILEEYPDVSETDLEIKLSDAVNKATQDKIKRANPNGGPPIPAVAGAFHGGLFPLPHRVGRYLGLEPANDDEDGDEDEDDFDINFAFDGDGRIRRDARVQQRFQQRVARRYGGGLAIRERLGGNPVPVEPRLQEPNILQPPLPAQQPHAQVQQGPFGLQGYIPVLGFHPPAANLFDQPLGAAVQPQQDQDPFNFLPGPVLGHEPGDPHGFDPFGFGGVFGGAGADPFGLNGLMNGAAFPGIIPPPVIPQPPAQPPNQQPGPQPAYQQQRQHQQRQVRENLIRRQADNVERLQQERTARAQPATAAAQQRQMQDRVAGYGQNQGLLARTPRRY